MSFSLITRNEYSSGISVSRVWPGALLLAILLIIGLLIYKDYGVSWDEVAMREIGDVNLEFVLRGNDTAMQQFVNRDHGAAFEVPLMIAEKVLHPKDFGAMIQLRHLLTYLFYLIGLWFGYLLMLRLYKRQWMAILGLLMLVLAPRIFAHAFFNSKDVPFLSAMLISIYCITAAFQDRKYWMYIVAGVASGYALGIRTPGIILVLPTAGLMLFDVLPLRRERKRAFLQLVLFLLSCAFTLYISWPALWHHPVGNLVDSLTSFSKYSGWDSTILFDGIQWNSKKLPWHYVPAWIFISTPILWLALGLIGCYFGARTFIRHPLRAFTQAKGRVLLLSAITFVTPIVAAIILHSVLYDDWRHLYFVYPFFVIIALFGVERLWHWVRVSYVVIAACSIQVLATLLFMVTAHPFQQVYFNRLVSHKEEYLRTHYDFEYWGTSFKQGLEWIIANDPRDTIPVERYLAPQVANWAALQNRTHKQIRWTEDMTPGSYYMTIYRFHPDNYPFQRVYTIKVCNSTVLDIYKIPDTTSK